MSRYEDTIVNIWRPIAGWCRHPVYELRLMKHAIASGLVQFTGTLADDGRPAWKFSHCGRDAARLLVQLLEAGAKRNPKVPPK